MAAAAVTDWLLKRHKRDFASLRASRRRTIRLVFVFALLCVAGFVFLHLLGQPGAGSRGVDQAVGELLAAQLNWGERLVDRYEEQQNWLAVHGTGFEKDLYENIAGSVFRLAGSSTMLRDSYDSLSFFGKITVSFLFAALRVTFIVVICWRIWLAAAVLAAVAGYTVYRVHSGQDLLGQAGNGRLFYSGILARLSRLAEGGVPDIQIPGLACPRAVSRQSAAGSDIGRLLEKFGALNDTNLALAAVIMFHHNYPAYVTTSDEESLLSGFFSGAGLAENCFLILEKALTLHAHYQSAENLSAGSLSLAHRSEDGKVDKYQNANFLEQAMHRVLILDMRKNLAMLKASEIACAVLAYEAGKVMTFAHESGMWLRKSAFCHLNARAILHSLPSYPRDFGYVSRAVIRRALIYCQRSTSFGQVHFPVDFSETSRALRQWIEILSACPHELQAVADEIELFGIISEAERQWTQAFFAAVMTIQPEAVEEVYATHFNLLFMPLPKIMKIVRGVLGEAQLRRLEELVAIVNQQQRLRVMSLDFSVDPEKPQSRNPHHIYSPLGYAEIKRLSELHSVPLEDVRDWSAARAIFSFGWLGRRVGDYSVPESSLIFAVFKMQPESGGGNTLGLLGHPGMVAFRASRLEAKWGRGWQSRFTMVESATMAETQEDYERLLAGQRDLRELEEENSIAGAS